MAARRIKNYKRNTLADTLGAVGQGLNGFASSYMGKKQLDMAKEQNEAQKAMQEKMMGLMENMYPQGAGQTGQSGMPSFTPFQATAGGAGAPAQAVPPFGQGLTINQNLLDSVLKKATPFYNLNGWGA